MHVFMQLIAFAISAIEVLQILSKDPECFIKLTIEKRVFH